MVNDKKIAFIICTNNERWYNECVQYLSRLELPDGFDADVLQIVDAKSMASGYNEGMHASDAKYKIYLHHDVFIIRTDFMKRVIRAFEEHPEVGIMGVIGTDKIVQDASYWNHWDCGKVYALDAMLPFKVCGPNTYTEGVTSAKAVDGMILMTQYDVEWREDIFTGWDFYDVSQCFEFARKGYEVAVFHENEISIMHDCGYSKLVNYNDSREKFCEEYAEFGFVYEKQEDKDKSVKEKDNSIKKFLDEINWLMSVDIDKAAALIGQVYSDTLRNNAIAILKIVFDIYEKEKNANRKCFFVNKGDTWEQLIEKYTEYKFLIRNVELEVYPEAVDELYDELETDRISLQAIGEIACHCCYNGAKVIRKLQDKEKSKVKSEVKNYYEIEEFQNIINTAEHVVNQIDRLRTDIYKKKNKNIKVEKNVLKAMGDSMVEIAQLLEMHSYYEEYNVFYSELQSGIYSSDICDKLMAWENDTREWISKLSEVHGVCNICKKVVKYLPNTTHFQAEQKKHGFPYWNAVFESVSKKKRMCPVCESMDRERMLSLMIDLLQPANDDKLNVLQIAPSFAMDNWLKTKTYMNYETTDLMLPNVTFQADIQDMNMVADETYDIILCSHILEHVKDDKKAMKELYRILKEDGVCLFLVPLMIGLDKTDEEFGLSEEENWTRFGQDDHARLYAREDFLDRLTDAGYLVHILGKEYFGEECWHEQGLNDIHCIYAATKKDIGIGVEPYKKQVLEEELVSVVIPTYNRGYCIERAVNSVLNQTWKNLEVIVVDDASTDDTEDVIRRMTDSRIRYIRYDENQGANHARNIGIKNARGNYIAFNDSDDEWLPQKLEKQMKQLILADRIDGNVGCVYCIVTKYENGKPIENAPDLLKLGENIVGDIYRFMHSHMFISTQTLLMKKEVFETVGMFNEDLKRLQDWELLLRVAQKYKFTLVQESLVNAYIQEECISKNVKGWIDTVFYVIDKHNLIETNRTAYRGLVKIGLSMMENSDLPEEYIKSILQRIKTDNVLKISGWNGKLLEERSAETIKKEKQNTVTDGYEIEMLKASMNSLKEELDNIKTGVEKNDRMLNEILWSQVFNSARAEFPWLPEKLALWPGRWGVGYQYMYAISRFLTELQPMCILETGLGQSTRLIGSYVKWLSENGKHCDHTVVEHDKEWIDIFRNGFTLSEDSKIIQKGLARVKITKDGHTVPTYIYKDMNDVIQNKKFDFISIDAPYGTDDKYGYSRIDIVNYLPGCLAKSFCIVLDDYNRHGEKNTVEYIKTILKQNNILFCEAVYRGTQDVYILVSPDWKYLCTL